MTESEYKRELEAFDEHGAAFGNPPDAQERSGYVATDNGKFVGCSSGLAQKHGGQYGKYLLFVKFEKFYPSGHAKVGLVNRI